MEKEAVCTCLLPDSTEATELLVHKSLLALALHLPVNTLARRMLPCHCMVTVQATRVRSLKRSTWPSSGICQSFLDARVSHEGDDIHVCCTDNKTRQQLWYG